MLNYTPSALGVTGDVVFQAVLLNLQCVVEGSVQLLHSHLDRTLQASMMQIFYKLFQYSKCIFYNVKEKLLTLWQASFSHFDCSHFWNSVLFRARNKNIFHRLYFKAHHIFLSSRWCIVLTDLQLQHVPLPVEGKTSKEFHHTTLVSKQLSVKIKKADDSRSLWVIIMNYDLEITVIFTIHIIDT